MSDDEAIEGAGVLQGRSLCCVLRSIELRLRLTFQLMSPQNWGLGGGLPGFIDRTCELPNFRWAIGNKSFKTTVENGD
jgi:hypothetical protein